MAGKPDKSLSWLAKYLSLALTLPASVFAGFFLGNFAADHWLRGPLFPVLGIVLGMCAGLIQIVRELSRETKPNGSKP